jgi:phosphoglycerol transferase MdoB-like AlkP superfamily enzyme
MLGSKASRTFWGVLLRNFFTVLTAFFILRLSFFIFHRQNYLENSLAEVIAAFVRGFRFDAAAAAIINAPYLFFSLVPFSIYRRTFYQRFLKIVFLSGNLFFLGFEVSDIAYHNFTGSRMTADIFLLRHEVAEQSGQLVFHYWYLFLLFSFLAALLWKGSTQLAERCTGSVWGRSVTRILVVFLVVVLGRGGFQMKVLKPLHAFESGDQEIGILSLNTSFAIVKSRWGSSLEPLRFFESDLEVAEILKQPSFPFRIWNPKQNVVVIILESFATEFWGVKDPVTQQSWTPFLDTLAERGVFFRNNFANGRRSIEALPSVLFGVPSLMSTPLAKSNFQGNQWIGLGHLLEKEGYHTSFFHGAKTGTMYFDAISQLAGIRDYYPLERYPSNRKDFDGNWGIYDEPFLQFMAAELSKHPRPFFSTVFTISTHQPYLVPKAYRETLPRGPLKIHQSVRYVDQALEKFFKAIEHTEWYRDTLFVMTGDHTQESKSLNYDTELGRYMVPMLMFHPKGRIPAVDATRITQHVDIFPSILDYVGIRMDRRPLFGRSVFSTNNGEAEIHSNGIYWLVNQKDVLQMDPAGNEMLVKFAGEKTKFRLAEGLDPQTQRLRSLRLKAYRQHFNNGLLKNSFYRASPERQ